MHCPYCGAHKDQLKVIDSRTADGGKGIRRRRECLSCGKRFTTFERIDPGVKLVVVKKDGRREPWDRLKVLGGVERACYKRTVPEAAIIKLAEEVEDEAQRLFEKEVPSGWIGEAVMKGLRELDQVAYVRFASVYRDFATLDELFGEMQKEIDRRRLQDPAQQELFALWRARGADT
jgi:transcriptional repressor NrdR